MTSAMKPTALKRRLPAAERQVLNRCRPPPPLCCCRRCRRHWLHAAALLPPLCHRNCGFMPPLPCPLPALQVRAVVICRPPVLNDRRLLPPGADALLELEVLPPAEALPAGAPDADLLRDICLAREGAKEGATLRLPLFGYHGGAGGAQLCVREVAPLLRRLLAGESAAVIAYGQTGSGKSYTMGTERYDEGQAPAPHSGACGATCRAAAGAAVLQFCRPRCRPSRAALPAAAPLPACCCRSGRRLLRPGV